MCGVIVVALLALLGITAFQGTTVGEVEPVVAPSQTVCPVTIPNGMTPPAEGPALGHHGNGLLYTVLGPDGDILAEHDFIGTDGSIGWKYPIWRAPGVGKAGDLEIMGYELTSGTPIRSFIPEGYGQRFQASGIYFPDEGCYEITVRSGEASLTFVTKVTAVDAPSALPRGE